MNGLFITGTDTDVGKTTLTALLLAELRRRNINAAPMKPAQTGCEKAQIMAAPDLDYSLRLAGMSASAEEYALMSPYRFTPPYSPHLAAEQAHTEIEIAEIALAAQTLTKRYDLILAEGAGGIMVPLNRRETTLDLMHALRLPVLIAARPGLGTINHTLLTIRTLRSDGLKVAGVVFVNSTNEPETLLTKDNRKTIEQFGKVPVLGTIDYFPALQTETISNLPEPILSSIAQIVDQLELPAS